MGTRDDEYDYLFKGAPCGVQTGEVAVATGGPKPCYRNRELRVEARTSTGPIRAGSRRKPGQVEFARLRALVRSGEPRGPRGGLGPRRGRGGGGGWGGGGPLGFGAAVGAGRPEGRGFPGFGGRTALKAGL